VPLSLGKVTTEEPGMPYLRIRHYIPFKHEELSIQQCSVTTKQTYVAINYNKKGMQNVEQRSGNSLVSVAWIEWGLIPGRG
jgi:hypothetical protein